MAEDIEDGAEDLSGRLGGVDLADQMGGVATEQVPGFLFIDLEAALTDLEVRVVEAVLLQGAALHTFDQHPIVRAGQVEEGEDFEGFLEDFGLAAVSGDAIEHEEVLEGVEDAGLGFGFDVLAPEADGEFVGDELALAGVFEESAAKIGIGSESAKDFAAGAMEIGRASCRERV